MTFFLCLFLFILCKLYNTRKRCNPYVYPIACKRKIVIGNTYVIVYFISDSLFSFFQCPIFYCFFWSFFLLSIFILGYFLFYFTSLSYSVFPSSFRSIFIFWRCLLWISVQSKWNFSVLCKYLLAFYFKIILYGRNFIYFYITWNMTFF